MFIAQVPMGPSKQLKQIIQTERNIVKNRNWPEANQLAINKRGRGFELGTSEKQIQVLVRAGFEPGAAGLRVGQSDHLATLYNIHLYNNHTVLYNNLYLSFFLYIAVTIFSFYSVRNRTLEDVQL